MIAKKLLNNIQKRGVYTINQNEYVGQTPVSIVNNTISLETNFVNKVNSIDNLQQDITTNRNSINSINTTLNGIPEQLTTITNNVSTNTNNITTNTQQIEAVKTKAETNTNSINTINTNLGNKLDTATYDSEKTNFAKTNEANTFVGKNTFKNTGDIVSIQRTDNQSFGIDFKKENGDRVAFVGTSSSEVDKATIWGVSGLKIQTTNSNVDINPGSGDCYVNTSKNWNQQLDNSVVRQRDTKWVRVLEYTSSITQPTTDWNRDSWKWTLSNLNSNNGIYEILFTISYADDVAATIRGEIMWKTGLRESRSQILSIEKNNTNFLFQFVIKNDNKLYVYIKKESGGSGANIKWVRGWIKRGITYPTKVNTFW